jgi:4-amino-4-deoxy-L-arabinose transferase-like glycosyltransferase
MKKNIMNQVLSTLKKLTKIQWIILIGFLVYVPLWIFTLQLASNVGYQANPELRLPTLGTDSTEYTILAQNLIEHHWFSMSTSTPIVPEVFRTIGYPLFVASIVIVFKSLFAVTFFQIVLTIGSALLIYCIGKKLFPDIVGFVAALIFIVEPTNIFHTLVILSDALFVFLLLLSVYILFFTESQNYKKIFVVGIIIGTATLVRPIAIFSLGIFVPLYFWLNYKKYTRHTVFVFLIALVLGYGLLVGPWTIRNKAQTGYWSLSSVTNVNLYHYNVPDFLAWKGMPRDQAYELVEKETGVSLADARLFENTSKIKELSKKYIIGDLIGYVPFHTIRGLPFIFSSGISLIDQFNTTFSEPMYKGHISQYVINAERFSWVGILFLALVSPVFFRREKSVYIFLIIVFYFWILTGPVAYARYRLPAEPFLLLLACATVYQFFKLHLFNQSVQKP